MWPPSHSPAPIVAGVTQPHFSAMLVDLLKSPSSPPPSLASPIHLPLTALSPSHFSAPGSLLAPVTHIPSSAGTLSATPPASNRTEPHAALRARPSFQGDMLLSSQDSSATVTEGANPTSLTAMPCAHAAKAVEPARSASLYAHYTPPSPDGNTSPLLPTTPIATAPSSIFAFFTQRSSPRTAGRELQHTPARHASSSASVSASGTTPALASASAPPSAPASTSASFLASASASAATSKTGSCGAAPSPDQEDTRFTHRRAKRKQKYTRSRLGCLVCRQRKVKCPQDGLPCTPCLRGNRECEYGPNPPPGRRTRKRVKEEKARLAATKADAASVTAEDPPDVATPSTENASPGPALRRHDPIPHHALALSANPSATEQMSEPARSDARACGSSDYSRGLLCGMPFFHQLSENTSNFGDHSYFNTAPLIPGFPLVEGDNEAQPMFRRAGSGGYAGAGCYLNSPGSVDATAARQSDSPPMRVPTGELLFPTFPPAFPME